MSKTTPAIALETIYLSRWLCNLSDLPRPVEGIRATGANRLQEIIYGVVPQVLPLWISFSLYRFETNVRSATVLGIVGAGGIGQILFESIRGFYYAETAAILIIVVITVSLIDLLSQRLRKLAI